MVNNKRDSHDNLIEDVSGGGRRIIKPKTEILPLTAQAFDYLTQKRGLHPDVIKAYRLGSDKNGRIVVPFYDETGELALVKFRHPQGEIMRWQKPDGEGGYEEVDGKSRIEPGGKGILFGSHLCDPAEGPLVIVFGDYDAMAVAQCGVPNSVGMPFGDGGFEFIKYQWNFLKRFNEIILYPDADDYPNPEAEKLARKKLDELARRLGKARVRMVNAEDRHCTKDANELLLKGVADPDLKNANREAIIRADWFPDGITKVADYRDEQIREGLPFGLRDIDRITNGAVGGELILIGGDNEAGKTTNLLNFIANFIEWRAPVFYWSGEQGVGEIRYWFERIVAGREFIKRETSSNTGAEFFFPIDEVKEPLRDWYRDYFYQLTDASVDARSFFAAAELAVCRYGCRVIAADNLMAFTGGAGETYFQEQGDFAEECKKFAEKWGVPFILLVHNKKEQKWIQIKNADGGSRRAPLFPDKNSVEGSKKVTNWADVLLQCYRTDEETREYFDNADGVIGVRKCRRNPNHVTVAMLFDEDSNRLFQVAENFKRGRSFGWAERTQWKNADNHQETGSTNRF